MAGIVVMIEEIIENYADPRVRHWKLVESPVTLISIIGIYLLMVRLLPMYMKDRKPYDLTTVIKCYNIFQIVSCVGLVYMIANAGWRQGLYSWGCQPVDYSNNFYAIKLLNTFYWHYWLKVTEMLETMFFILRKKFNQVSYLHVYHHASTLVIAYCGCKFIGGGMSSVAPMINSCIHILMYTYYYLSSLGKTWQNRLVPWKSKLTMMQMIQFTLLIMHSSIALLPSCKFQKRFIVGMYIPNVILIFKMFYDFYNKSYKKSVCKSNMSNIS